jgi:hypothetical protein
VQLDYPRAVRLCQNITLGADVSKLVFFELRYHKQSRHTQSVSTHHLMLDQ